MGKACGFICTSSKVDGVTFCHSLYRFDRPLVFVAFGLDGLFAIYLRDRDGDAVLVFDHDNATN